MGTPVRGKLQRLAFGLIAATTLCGCTPQKGVGSSNGVKFEIAGPMVKKTKVHMDGTKLYINGDYYGTAVEGDSVVVSDVGAVSVNGKLRAKQ